MKVYNAEGRFWKKKQRQKRRHRAVPARAGMDGAKRKKCALNTHETSGGDFTPMKQRSKVFVTTLGESFWADRIAAHISQTEDY